MATMASTHSLSMLTNSSIKPPLNPKTGLSNTMHERPGPIIGRFSGVYFDDYDQQGQTAKEILHPMSTKFAATADPASLVQLSKLSDDEFYNKLLELKDAQRRTLQKCEKIYLEKHKDVNIVPTFSDTQLRTKTLVDDDGMLISTRTNEHVRERSPSPVELERMYEQNQREMMDADSQYREYESMSKPPTGRPHVSYMSKSQTGLARPSSAPLRRDVARSLDDLRTSVNELRKSFEASDDEYIPDDTVSEPYRERDRSVTRIDDMWQNFTIEDYAPRRTLQRPSSATITRKEKKEKVDSWRHRLTVPKPFTMTVREEHKEKRKSRNMQEFEEQMYQQQLEEEEELKKKFKARPVPAHVYLPLFDEIQERSEEQRRHIRQTSAEVLRSQEKPFSFTKREEDRKLHVTHNQECNGAKHHQEKSSAAFKAKPVPKSTFDSQVDEKLMEEEEYRKIRIKMRAQEMLKTASLPPNMKAREELKVQQERQHKLKSKRKESKRATRPRINHDVPNYDALYHQFQQELQRRKGAKEATISHPFQLETNRTSRSAREKIKKEIEREEHYMKENRWPYKMRQSHTKVKLGHMSASLDALPAKSTKSADCRNSKTRARIQELSQKEVHEIEEERRRRVREMKLRREIHESSNYRNGSITDNPEEKKKQSREAERARMEEYERELQEMKERVNRRPLLFEQECQVNAKKKAEKKFNATLRSVGLDEDFVHSRGSRSASIHDYTDEYDDEEFEDTAVKYSDETYTRRRDSDRSLSPCEA